MKRHYPALQGIAITLVVFNHSLIMANNIPIEMGYPPIEGMNQIIFSILGAIGIFAVPTFFFISGGFFAYASKTKENEHAFLLRVSWKSTLHVLWPYFFWSIAFYSLVLIGRGETYTITGYLKNLLVGYPFHFVPLLVFNYLLAPLYINLNGRIRWVFLVIVIIYQTFLISYLTQSITHVSYPYWVSYLVPPIINKTLANWGVYFPLGVILGLNSKIIDPYLHKVRFPLLGLTIISFLFYILTLNSGVINMYLRAIIPVFFVGWISSIARKSIPKVRLFEQISKRVYGIYLMHLIVMYITLLLLSKLPQIMNIHILMIPFLFFLGLSIPINVMKYFQESKYKKYYPYIFG